jgi:pimeloyl-ACP methyl ester carboxylesterase
MLPNLSTKNRSRLTSRAVALAVVGICTSAGCRSPWQDLFHVQSAGARLPVVVYGEADASTIVLFQHGGPDGAAGIDPLPPGLANLTEEALVVTWAQRSTGLASGISRTRDNTIAQHVSDLHAVRQAVAMRYPGDRRLVLAGHSWGVSLTLAYLDRYGEAGLAGLVLTDGFDAFGDNAERSFARLAELASERADDTRGETAAEWREIEAFALEAGASRAPYATETIFEASSACARIEQELDRPETEASGKPALGAVTSPLIVPDGLLVSWNLRTMFDELTTFDQSASVEDRRLPALLVWGENDCRVPVATGESLLARYGGDATMVVVEGATHFAIYSQPHAFAEPTLSFLAGLP